MTSSVKSKPKFRLIEGGDDYSDIYEDFKKDYLSVDTTVEEILNKYNITNNKYQQLKKQVAEETGVNRKPSMYGRSSPWIHEKKYIDRMKSNGKYRVSKWINGSNRHFGVYDDLETATMIRDKLWVRGWTQKAYREIKIEYFGEDPEEQLNIEEIYDDFKKDFMKGHSVDYLMEKWNLSTHFYRVLSKMIRSEENLVRKPQMSYREVRAIERGSN